MEALVAGRQPDVEVASTTTTEMHDTKSHSACNFPQFLARDLEVSEVTFLSKNMTAGAPIRGLANGEARPLYIPIDGADRHVEHKDAFLKDCSLSTRGEPKDRPPYSDDNGASSSPASLTSESDGESWLAMESPTICMRSESVSTAATSVTLHWAARKEDSRCSLESLETGRKGQSWVDLEVDEADCDVDEPAQAARTGPPTKQPRSSGLPFRDGVFRPTSPASSGVEEEASGDAFPQIHLLNTSTSVFPLQSPQTSSAPAAPRKPCPISISSSPRSPKRSSLQNTRALRQSIATMSGLANMDATSRRVSESDDDNQGYEPAMSEIISNYAAMDDGEHGNADSAETDEHATHANTMTVAETAGQLLDEAPVKGKGKALELLEESEPLSAIAEQSSASNSSSTISKSDAWFRSKVDLNNPVARPPPLPGAPFPLAGVPLPPDVLESLRCSIASFPDTMLQTSSLSIETIRAYSKKLKRDDSSAPVPLSLLPAEPPSSGNKLRKVSSLFMKAQPSQPPVPSPVFPAAAAPLPPSLRLCRIFPTASPYLCDSLYAHLVAYLYLTSLCGPDETATAVDSTRSLAKRAVSFAAASSAPATGIKAQAQAHMFSRKTPTSASTGTSIGTRIPHKAASLLGIGSVTTTRPSSPSESAAAAPRKTSKFNRALFKGKAKTRAAEEATGDGEEEGTGRDDGADLREQGTMVPAKEEKLRFRAGGEGETRPPPSRANNEAGLRELRAGLLRCVCGLIARARAPTGAYFLDADREMEECGPPALDPYLLRALYEVVKAGEEETREE